MERLTERVGEFIRIKGCKTLYGGKERKGAYLYNAIVRLAEYEDLGQIAHLRELVEAAQGALAFGAVGDYDTLHVYEAKDRIEALPYVMPQVVRCEDCIFYHPNDQNEETCWNVGGMTEPDADDFCSRWAEKAGGSSRLTPRKRGQDDADN